MKIITNTIFLDHETEEHPENKGRLLVFDQEVSQEITIDGSEFLDLVHTEDHIQRIRETSDATPQWLDKDTRASPGSYRAAVAAVGATIMASETDDFALVRPPGHHSFANRHSGFCFFNNVSIASERLRSQGKRVLILDFDGHLGDGTSDIFYKSPDILYWSLHQFPAFPGNGQNSEIGEGVGLGYNVNVPLPPGTGDDIFMHAFKSYLPIIEQFLPDVIAVSAGFDAHRFDPLLQLNVTVSSFFEIGRLIRERCNHIFAVLEGGYNKDVLPRGVYSFIAGINGEELPFPEKPMTSGRTLWESYELDLHLGISNLSDFWKF